MSGRCIVATADGTLETHSSREPALWYAAYTCANHEKRVAGQLAGRCVEHFLPLYETVHQWKDRRVRLKLPLFPGYVFVRLAFSERVRVLQVPGVARLVGFGQTAEPLPDEEIEALQRGLGGEMRMQPHAYIREGSKVRILRGPLAGIQGVLLREKANLRLVLSVDLIMRSVVVDVDAADICPIDGSVAREMSGAARADLSSSAV